MSASNSQAGRASPASEADSADAESRGRRVSVIKVLVVWFRAVVLSQLTLASTDDRTSKSAADLNAERLLWLLGRADMTVAGLIERGVQAPAQGVYDLQLAGYPIERI